MEPADSLRILIAAAWCGLLAGLLEGVAFLRFPLLRNPDLPWIAVLFALFVFLVLGFGFALVGLYLRGRALVTIANFVFLFLLFYDCATVGVGDHSRRLLLRLLATALALCLGLIAFKFAAGWQALQARTLPWIAVLALLYTGVPPVRRIMGEHRSLAGVSATNHAPNVLIIVIDALRANHLSTYGYARNTSPFLTQLAARGVRFNNAVAPASWTLPSHASILTGRLPHETGADRPDGYLDERLPTLPETFQARGYRTAAFSANWWFFARRLGFARGFMHFEDFDSLSSALSQTNLGQRVQNLLLKVKLLHHAVGRSRADQINSDILHWLDHGHGPFFVVANYMDVHEPYLPPLDCFHRYSRLSRPAGKVFLGNPHLGHLTPAEVQDEADAYDASIDCLDARLASLVHQLEQRGMMRNTILVFTADHGEAFGEHGLMSHGNSLYRELVHVPLIMVGPGIPQRSTVDRPVSLMWLTQTLQVLTGAGSQLFSGPVMSQTFSGTAPPVWPDPVSELAQMYDDPAAPNFGGELQSITSFNWHLIVNGRGQEELYLCCQELTETHNLASENTAVVDALHEELRHVEAGEMAAPLPVSAPPQEQQVRAAQRVSTSRPRPERKHDTEADRQKINDYLKALGYAPN